MATITEALDIALQHHEAGRLTEAEILYDRILEVEPEQPLALHLLGVLLCQTQRPEDGVQRLRTVVALDPDNPALRFDLARARLMLAEGGSEANRAAALAGLRQAVALEPDHRPALFQLALALQGLGHARDALAGFRHVLRLDPEHRHARHLAARILMEQGKADLAAGRIGSALAILGDPILEGEGWTVVLSRGADLLTRREAKGASRIYRAVLIADPADPVAILNEALCRLDLDDPDMAERMARRACVLLPENPAARLNRGLALAALGRGPEAAAAYRGALACDPAQAPSLVNLGSSLLAEGRDEAACVWAERSVRVAPDRLDTALIRAGLLAATEDDDAALAACRSAIALAPGHADAHWALALTLLRLGRYAEGWDEYEWRWRSRALDGQHRNFTAPRWIGEPLDGKSILVHAEQGIGDTIQFIRFLDRVIEANPARLYLEAHAPLRSLLEDSFGGDRVTLIYRAKDFPGTAGLPATDVQIPLMSLAGLFCRDLSQIPARSRYLRADSVRRARWAERIGQSVPPGALRCGLVWAGRPQYRADATRSLPLSMLAPLAGIDGVSLVSLQVGEAARQEIAGSGYCLIDLADGLTDFAETAAALDNLDLVITVDTAVAHLAGALGRPVWLLIPRNCDWRWLKGRDDSPWYPSARLFRQRVRGDWRDPIAEISMELQRIAR